MPAKKLNVRLLFDQNVSPRLVGLIGDLYPNSIHVRAVGLDRAPDDAIWIYAKDNGFAILAKDEDFNQMSVIRGFPPKVIWLKLGNCTTEEIEFSLRENHSALEHFFADPNIGTFVLR
jgi:predicted nuclease of predicted toxin-antitoxin system